MEYRCAKCGANDCKLWREYQTFSPKLLCAICAAESEEKDISDIDAMGTRRSDLFPTGPRIDQIGWYVPAIGDGEGNYWGYSSVPDDGVAAWQMLPTLRSKDKYDEKAG